MSTPEGLQAIFAGERPPRPLVDLGGRVASLSAPAYLALKGHLGFGSQLERETVTLLNTIGEIDGRVLDYFEVPFRRIYLQPAATFQLTVDEAGSFRDEWGVTYRPMGPYNERVGHPLAEATIDDLPRYPWPDPADPSRSAGLEDQARWMQSQGEIGLVAGHISAGIFQDCWNLRGMQRFMMDLALERDFAEALLERVTQIHIGMWAQFLDQVGPYVAIVETADDLGGQNGPLISPKMYRELIKPRHAALNAAIRERTSARILYHSCGAILPLVADLIEIGVQILNPIQPLPGWMDPERLRQEYGHHLIFHGGLDVQKLLPEGKPGEVRRHVWRYLDALGPERYIMAPANSVQPGTPPLNVIAAYRAAAEYPSGRSCS